MIDFQATVKTFKEGAKHYTNSLTCLSDEAAATRLQGVARSALDMTYEVAIVNRRIATRLRREDPGPMPFKFGEWLHAPADWTRQGALEEFNASCKDILDSAGEDGERKIKTTDGETDVQDLVNFMAVHISYHDAQLNYIQALHGDTEVHWNLE